MGEMIGNIAQQWRLLLNTLGLTGQQLLMFYDMDGFTRAPLQLIRYRKLPGCMACCLNKRQFLGRSTPPTIYCLVKCMYIGRLWCG